MTLSLIDCVAELFAYTYYLAENLNSQQPEFETVKANYTDLIGQARECGKSAGISKKKMDSALFPVFAWIDEVLLETAWTHKQEWVKHSLQKVYFNTTNAGETFFKRLEKLGGDDRDLLEVYQYCLASGFKGSLYQSYYQEQLKNYRDNALKKIASSDAMEVPDILFPESGKNRTPKQLKRKRWKGLAGFSYLFVLLPVLLFVSLFYFFDNALNHMIRISGIF